MARDYKNRVPGYRNRAGRNKKPTGARWAIGLAAAAAGLGAWLIFHGGDKPGSPPSEPPKTTQLPAPPPHPPAKPEDKKAVKPEDKKVAKPEGGKDGKQTEPDKKANEVNPQEKLPEPRFTFYKILPEKEVIIPESEIKALKQEESLGKKQAAIQYLLQAGSFPNPQDAEKLKARLSAIKIKSRIESVKIENLVWSRVKIGPFASLADADRVRTYLRSNQIDSVVQKALGSAPHQTGR